MTDRGKGQPKCQSRKASSNEEKQENLRKKKELIRNNKARGITLSRRKGRLVRQLSCVSDNDPDDRVEIDLTKYLPPLYTTSKKVKHLIEVRLFVAYRSVCCNTFTDKPVLRIYANALCIYLAYFRSVIKNSVNEIPTYLAFHHSRSCFA